MHKIFESLFQNLLKNWRWKIRCNIYDSGLFHNLMSGCVLKNWMEAHEWKVITKDQNSILKSHVVPANHLLVGTFAGCAPFGREWLTVNNFLLYQVMFCMIWKFLVLVSSLFNVISSGIYRSSHIGFIRISNLSFYNQMT